MIILTLAASIIVIALGLGLLVHGALHAPVGFEDDTGFHLEVMPSRADAAISYAGPERRRTGRRGEWEPGLAICRYNGPPRRAADLRHSHHLEFPHLGGVA
jgi:hypothetical protein